MKRKGGVKLTASTLIAIVILASLTIYLYYQLNTINNLQKTEIEEMQRTVDQLLLENSKLQNKQILNKASVNFTLQELDPVKIYQLTNRSVVVIQGVQVIPGIFGPTIEGVLGSGFVISYNNSYYVITNFHVINKIVNMTVTFWNGNSYPARAVGADPYSDLGVVVVNAPSFEFHPLNLSSSSLLKVGEPVVAIGNPFGLAGSMTFGIISQVGRTITESLAGNFPIANVIQFSAPINPGNSGGPLLNGRGEVVGVTTAVVAGSQGVGFAIPSDTIIKELPFLIKTGTYKLHSYLGIQGVDMNYQLAKVIGINYTYGVIIQAVVPAGPANKAGLRGGTSATLINGQQYLIGGDIIVSINGTKIINTDALSTYLEQRTIAGQTVQLGIIRDRQLMFVNVILGARPQLQS